jgi:hypothetical protein
MTRHKEPGWGDEFRRLYDKVSHEAPGITPLSLETKESIAELLDEDQTNERTGKAVTSAIVTTVSIIPFLLLLRLSAFSVPRFFGQFKYPFGRPELVLVMVSVALCILFFLFLLWIARPDLRNRRYYGFVCITLWLLVPPIYIPLAAVDRMYRHLDSSALELAAIVWLTFTLTGISIIAISRAMDRFYEKVAPRGLGESQQRVLLELLFLVDDIGVSLDLAVVTRRKRCKLVDDIARIARLIGRLHSGPIDQASTWASQQMELASRNFLCVASWPYLPQDTT